LLATTALGCAGAGQYVWFKELPASEQGQEAGDYILGIGDAVSVRVYEQDSLSGDYKVRSDGKIALPLAGEVLVAGKRPIDLSRELEGRLKEFVVTPRVTVNVTEARAVTVTTLGEITTVGAVTLSQPARLVDVLAKAGGLNAYANPSKIFVMRQFPSFRRIRFEWEAIQRNEGGAAGFLMRNGDIIVVE
jgi:polysaccharide biosynthesis/export protein